MGGGAGAARWLALGRVRRAAPENGQQRHGDEGSGEPSGHARSLHAVLVGQDVRRHAIARPPLTAKRFVLTHRIGPGDGRLGVATRARTRYARGRDGGQRRRARSRRAQRPGRDAAPQPAEGAQRARSRHAARPGERARPDRSRTTRCAPSSSRARATGPSAPGPTSPPWRRWAPTEGHAYARLGHDVLGRIDDLDVPVVAAVNGVALGGGLELVLACDLAFAAERARLGLPEITLGLIPGFGGTQRLARRIGLARARELIYLGSMVGAADGLRLGIVDRVVPDERLADEAAALAAELAKRPPVALRQAKRATRAAVESGSGRRAAARDRGLRRDVRQRGPRRRPARVSRQAAARVEGPVAR